MGDFIPDDKLKVTEAGINGVNGFSHVSRANRSVGNMETMAKTN